MKPARRFSRGAVLKMKSAKAPGRGYNVNVPLPPETYDEAFLMAFDSVAVPLVEFFRPEVIVLELGLDALAGDPLTHLRLTNNAVVEVLERLLRFNRPMLVAGGGGYHVENTVRGWALAWRTCCGENDECDFGLGMGGVMLASTRMGGRPAGPRPWPSPRNNAAPWNRNCRPPLKPSTARFFGCMAFTPAPTREWRRPARFR